MNEFEEFKNRIERMTWHLMAILHNYVIGTSTLKLILFCENCMISPRSVPQYSFAILDDIAIFGYKTFKRYTNIFHCCYVKKATEIGRAYNVLIW